MDFEESAGVRDAKDEQNRPVVVHVAATQAGAVRLHVQGYYTQVANLTPDQARFMARKLYRMARLVEAG